MGSGNGGGADNHEALHQYFQQIVSPIQTDFVRVFDRADFASIAQNAQVISHVDRLVNVRSPAIARAAHARLVC
jgi:hypothetical protein